MSQYVKPAVDETVRPPTNIVRQTVNVSTLTTVIVPPTSMRGHDQVFLELVNDAGADTLNAQVELSADGTAPWLVMTNDAFAGMAAGTPRSLILDAQYQFFRVTGAMATTLSPVRRTVIFQSQSVTR